MKLTKQLIQFVLLYSIAPYILSVKDTWITGEIIFLSLFVIGLWWLTIKVHKII